MRVGLGESRRRLRDRLAPGKHRLAAAAGEG